MKVNFQNETNERSEFCANYSPNYQRYVANLLDLDFNSEQHAFQNPIFNKSTKF